jgi:hypothetical protein
LISSHPNRDFPRQWKYYGQKRGREIKIPRNPSVKGG